MRLVEQRDPEIPAHAACEAAGAHGVTLGRSPSPVRSCRALRSPHKDRGGHPVSHKQGQAPRSTYGQGHTPH
jgi:hypothetical protein